METELPPKTSVSTFQQFKSYYVVWKLETDIAILKTQYEFKSYYVVWKHENKLISGGSCYVFKSYYVVWKLFYCV